eukprot:9113582-Pyramimonas_sp.AAC.1
MGVLLIIIGVLRSRARDVARRTDRVRAEAVSAAAAARGEQMVQVYALYPHAIGSRSGYMLSTFTRLAPAP